MRPFQQLINFNWLHSDFRLHRWSSILQKFAHYINRQVKPDYFHIRTCSLEVMILDFDTSDHGSSPSLALICDFLLFKFFSVCFYVVIFGVEKTCFIIIHALLPAFLHVRHLASICKYNQEYRRTESFDTLMLYQSSLCIVFVLFIIVIILWYFWLFIYFTVMSH